MTSQTPLPDTALAEAEAAARELREAAAGMDRMEPSLRLAEMTGTIAAFRLNAETNRVAMLKALAEIKRDKSYQGCVVRHTLTGVLITVRTWEEFCEALGHNRRKIDEDLSHLATFGGAVLEQQQSLGLGRRDLRALRRGVAAMTPEEQAALREELDAAEGNEALEERLDELRAALSREERRRKELEQDLRAREEVSAQYQADAQDARERLARLTSMTEEAQERVEAMNEAACNELDAACNAAQAAVTQVCALGAQILADERATPATIAHVARRCGIMADYMAENLLNSGIDVDLRERLMPIDGDAPGEAS